MVPASLARKIEAQLKQSHLKPEEIVNSLGPELLDKALLLLISRREAQPYSLLLALLKGGANPNAVDAAGTSVLFKVITDCNGMYALTVMRTLLDNGACPNMAGFMSVFNHRGGHRRVLVRPLVFCAIVGGYDMKYAARILIERGAHPISKLERAKFAISCSWYDKLARGMGRCLLAMKATERALSKAGLVHKDVIPMIGHSIFTMRCFEEWWLDK